MSGTAISVDRAIPKVRASIFEPVKAVIDRVGEAFDRYGDVVQVTGYPVKVFCFRAPDHIGTFLRDPVVGKTKLPSMMPRVKKVMRSGGYILAGGAEWEEQRNQVRAAFTGPYLNGYSQCVVPRTNQMLDRWLPHAKTGQPFDMRRPIQSLVFQTAIEMFASVVLAGDELERLRKQTEFVDQHFLRTTPLWNIWNGIQFNWNARGLRQAILKVVRARRAKTVTAPDFLSVLFSLQRAGAGRPWTDDEVADELTAVYFGASVMATTLAMTLLGIAQHPNVQDRLIEEIRSELGGQPAKMDDLGRLKYLQMVLQEAFRMYPASWGFPRYCEAGMEIDGYQIPPKSMLLGMIYHSQRNPKLWDNPEQFDPERFNSDNRAKIPQGALIPFSTGPRICLGASLGPIVLRLVLATVLQRYRLLPRPRFVGDPELHFGFEIHPTDLVMVSAQPA